MNLPILLLDEKVSQELAQMQNPTQSWASLVACLSTNKTFDEMFATWWQDSDRVNLSTWAATNGLWTPTNK
jgi:hypothetical protein